MSDGNIGNQYLTFRLGDEVFALEISHVREVLDYTHITRVPRSPDFLCGVINLRGNVVPVIDLKLSLGMEAIVRTVETCIIIVEITVGGEPILLGALSDSVQEVVEIDPKQIDPPPKLGTRFNTEYLKGMGKHEDRFVIILDFNRVLSSDDLDIIESASDIRVDVAANEKHG